MAAKRGKDVGSGKMPLPNGTIAELRTARDQLYSDMGKDPTTQVPWTFVQLLEKVNMMVDGQHPEKNNGMEKVLSQTGRREAESNPAQTVAEFLAGRVGMELDYGALRGSFPGIKTNTMNGYLGRLKRNEKVTVGGSTYKVTGASGKIKLEQAASGPKPNLNVRMLDGPKPARKDQRALLFLYNHPDATDSEIAKYAESGETRIEIMLADLRRDGYVNKGSRTLTAEGTAAAQRIEETKNKPADPLLPRVREYLKQNEGKDVDRETVVRQFSGEGSGIVSSYFTGFVSGMYKISDYSISRTGKGKLRVEKINKQPGPLPGDEKGKGNEDRVRIVEQPDPTKATGLTQRPGAQGHGATQPDVRTQDYRRGASELYLDAVGSIGDVYAECPELKKLIGNRLGLERPVLAARQNLRRENAGRFYETVVDKIPLDHGYMGNPHNRFFELVIKDPGSAGKLMGWVLNQDGGVTTESFMAEIDKYKPVMAR